MPEKESKKGGAMGGLVAIGLGLAAIWALSKRGAAAPTPTPEPPAPTPTPPPEEVPTPVEYKCPICGEVSGTWSDLQYHMLVVHGTTEGMPLPPPSQPLPPSGILTIDGLGVAIDFTGKIAHASITITNDSSETIALRDEWGDPVSLIFEVYGYYGETFTIPQLGKTAARTYKPQDPLHMIYQLGKAVIYSIAPGTQEIGASYSFKSAKCYTGNDQSAQTCTTAQVIREGLKGLACVHIYIPKKAYFAGFKGKYSSQQQTWAQTPVLANTAYYLPYMPVTQAIFPEAEGWAQDP